MKKIFFVALLVGVSSWAVAGDAAVKKQKDEESLCKLFQEKAERYKKTMRHDDYALATLASYEKRAALYCKEGK